MRGFRLLDPRGREVPRHNRRHGVSAGGSSITGSGYLSRSGSSGPITLLERLRSAANPPHHPMIGTPSSPVHRMREIMVERRCNSSCRAKLAPAGSGPANVDG